MDKYKNRCYNPNDKYYKCYGGRGIIMCDEWKNNFVSFLDSMGEKPSKTHSIDRIDVNGNYEPNNCRWATPETQARNQRMRKDNTSGIRGVGFKKSNNKWYSEINVNKKRIHLGYFNTIEEATETRKQAEIKYWHKAP